jgi:hypothetical protein
MEREVVLTRVFDALTKPEPLVDTESWEDWDPGESLITTVPVEQGVTTTLTSTALFPSQEVRDRVGVLNRGLEGQGEISKVRARELHFIRISSSTVPPPLRGGFMRLQAVPGRRDAALQRIPGIGVFQQNRSPCTNPWPTRRERSRGSTKSLRYPVASATTEGRDEAN